jgi:hypothetical protein
MPDLSKPSKSKFLLSYEGLAPGTPAHPATRGVAGPRGSAPAAALSGSETNAPDFAGR